MRLIEQQRVDPFAVNIGGSPRPKDVRDRQLKQQVPHGGGIKDVRIKKDGVDTHGLP